jgi:hypothetical protein
VTIFQDPASSNPIQFTGQVSVTLTGVVYVPDALVGINGKANVTIDPGAGRATLPPYSGALIAYDLKVAVNAVLTINPDPPGGAEAAVVLAGSSSIGASASIAPSAALGSSLSGSTANNAVLPYLLNGNLQALVNNPSSVPASPSTASATNQPIVSQLFASDASPGLRSPRSMTKLSDLWNEQLMDELFAQ